MKTRTETRKSLSELTHLASFAQYLLQHRLEEFVRTQYDISLTLDIPLLKFFRNMPVEQLLELSRTGAVELLTALSEGRAQEFIDRSILQWKQNQLPVVKRDEIAAEDITLVSYARKQAMLHFIPGYAADMEQAIDLIRDIDLFLTASETASTNTYINLLQQKISEDNLLLEKVNQTIPGAVYVFDLEKFKGIYSNNKLSSIIGYDHRELNDLGTSAVSQLVHPEDRDKLLRHLEILKKAKDGEVKVCKYRIRDRYGAYRWVANNESVFKRDDTGNVVQTIGITLDIDKEELISDALRKKDMLHRQAEAITHIGNYTWNIRTNELNWSEELYRIHGLDPDKDKIDYALAESLTHEADRSIATDNIKKAIDDGKPFDFYYRVNTREGLQKVVHCRGYLLPENPDLILGTVQDVTEKQNLISELEKSGAMYRQAEQLANMGNWSWDLATNKITWTDQLYRIYGLTPGEETITIERFISMVHPDDRTFVEKGIDELMEKKTVDYTFRIVTPDNTVKILRSVAQLQRDDRGNPVMVFGTERDTTEKQSLIDKLKRSENLYKQAQLLAHVGNWSWDIRNNTIEWSDELYRIFGRDPAEGNLTYEEYLTLIHPDDLSKTRGRIELALKNKQSWEFTHKIRRKNGGVRIISATGEVLVDEKGEPYMLIGTSQDVTEKQMLIEKLQESEKLYKSAQVLAKMGNWSLDVKTKDFTWSDEMYAIFELDPSVRMTFDEWLNYIHADDRDEVLRYYEECLAQKKMYDKIHKILLPGGKTKIIHRKGEWEFGEDGMPVRMVGTTQDITEDYRVQQELKENQVFIQKITDATPSIIASYNVNTGKYVFISEGLEKLLGYDRSLVMQSGVQFFIDRVHPEDLAGMTEKNNQVMEEANSNPDLNSLVAEFTYRMRHTNGEYRWFHTYGTIFDRNAEGRVEHVLNISLDVTEQVEATQKIKDQEHFIQQIADASPTILYLYNVKTQSIEYINREIFFVLGYLPEEILDAGSEVTRMIYHPEDYHLLPGRKESSKNFQQVDSMIQYECRLKNKDGEWRWLLVREIVFKTDESGQITQVLGAALDINRRKEMERTILQNTLLLEQSNASLEEFAYVASHDLKEPLRKISTFGDRLVATQMANLAPDGKMYLQKIVDASQRMQTMINDLLAISMISGNTAYETASLQKIFEETIQTLEFKIEQQNAIITSDPLPEARIISSQFRQLFQNLLSNSLKFVRPGVQPVISIRHTIISPEETGHYQLAQATRYHKLEFSDNGIGFENEFAGKIFAIFQRLHGRSEYEGSGIGLAICKKIVEHHGGVIYARGIPDAGATFTIILPA